MKHWQWLPKPSLSCQSLISHLGESSKEPINATKQNLPHHTAAQYQLKISYCFAAYGSFDMLYLIAVTRKQLTRKRSCGLNMNCTRMTHVAFVVIFRV